MCNYIFSNMADVKEHLKSVHHKDEWNWMTGEFKTVFPCNDCEIRFDNKSNLRKHIDIDHNEVICTQKTAAAHNVSNAAVTEEFICDFCDRQCKSLKEKFGHMRFVHTQKHNELPCGFCDKVCISKTDLCDHISSNHKEVYIKEEPNETSYSKEDGEADVEVVIVEEQIENYHVGTWDDGISFGGKRKEFGQATLEILKLFHTNKEYELEGVKFSLVKKDKEIKGSGVTYTLKVEEGKETGSAVLKSWEKNSKKEYKLVVSKLKGYDIRFVKGFGGVTKSLLYRSISGEGWNKMKSQNTIGCDLCGKFFSAQRAI